MILNNGKINNGRKFLFISIWKRQSIEKVRKIGSKKPQLAGYFLWLQRWKSNTEVNSNNNFFFLNETLFPHVSQWKNSVTGMPSVSCYNFFIMSFAFHWIRLPFLSEQQIESLTCSLRLWTCIYCSLHSWHLNEKCQ